MSAREIIANAPSLGSYSVYDHVVGPRVGRDQADAILSALRSAGFAVVKVDPYMQSLTSPMRPVLDKLLDGLMPVLHEFTPDRSGMIVGKVADAFRSAITAAKDAS
jgi:hypothetical protein